MTNVLLHSRAPARPRADHGQLSEPECKRAARSAKTKTVVGGPELAGPSHILFYFLF